MPVFVSRQKSPSYAIEPFRSELHTTSTGIVHKKYRAKWLKFEPIPGGMDIPGDLFPTKDGKAWGALDTMKAARDLGIHEKKVEKFLRGHERFGIDFASLTREAKYEMEEPEQGEDFIQELEDGVFHCQVCNREIKNWVGVRPHARGKAHVENLKQYQEGIRELIPHAAEETVNG